MIDVPLSEAGALPEGKGDSVWPLIRCNEIASADALILRQNVALSFASHCFGQLSSAHVAMTSTSTLNSGRVKPLTISSVDAGLVSPVNRSLTAM